MIALIYPRQVGGAANLRVTTLHQILRSVGSVRTSTLTSLGPKRSSSATHVWYLSIGSCNQSRRGSIEHDADLAGRALIGDAIGLVGLLQRVAVCDDAIRVKVPAHEVLKQFFHVTQ